MYGRDWTLEGGSNNNSIPGRLSNALLSISDSWLNPSGKAAIAAKATAAKQLEADKKRRAAAAARKAEQV